MSTKDCCQPVKEKNSLLPLYILLIFVLLSSVLLSYIFPSQAFMMYLMGIWFLSFGVLKLIDLPSFAHSFAGYDLIASRWKGYGYIYPFIEILLGGIYIGDIYMQYLSPVNTIALIISILGLISAFRVISSGKNISCACMGTHWKLPMTKVTVFENAVMIVMILFMMLFPNAMMNMGSMKSDMNGMLMDKNTHMSSEMIMPSSSLDSDPMREHCKMMPEMQGCEKYR